MDNDKLEKLIDENRDQFDHKNPGSSVWNTIKFRMGFDESKSLNIWWKVAAIVFFGTSVMLFLNNGNAPIQEVAAIEKSDDFYEVEQYYHRVINDKRDLINFLSEELILGDEAERDLNRLTAMYDVLREEFEQNPSKKVADAMILNLLVRIDILNDELQQADESQDIST